MYTVTVAFRADREYEFHVHADDVAGLDQSGAREWLHEEFDELECTPTNPMGKVLVLDVILNVAKYGGEQRFAQGAPSLLQCEALKIDGDIHFGANVRIEGSVHLRNPTDTAARIADGSRIHTPVGI